MLRQGCQWQTGAALLALAHFSMQSTLAPAPTSAVPPMVTATCAGYSALAALFAAVAISGYAAFGAAVQVC